MYNAIWLMMRGVPLDVWSHRIKARKQFIGRAKECAIQLLDQKVSRQHAKIWERGGVVFIRDLDSRNGTFVDGVRITRCALLSGKQLRIGELTFEIVTSQSTVRTNNFDRLTSSTEHEVMALSIPDANLSGLSDGQRQVLRLLVQGASEKQVAASLAISYHTVHSHVKDIYRQLGVHSRGELMALCWTQEGKKHIGADMRTT